MTETERDRQDAVQRRALEDLERLKRPDDTLGRSALAEAANRAQNHFIGKDAQSGDRIEVWGVRIARVAAAIFVAWLIYSLISGTR